MQQQTRMSLAAMAALGIVPFSLEVIDARDPRAQHVPESVRRFTRMPGEGGLFMPSEPSHQLVAADLDGDGDQDKTMIQIMPLQAFEGKTAAAAGGAAEFSVEPSRPCVVLALKFIVVLASGSIDNLFLTAFEAADVNLLPAKGAAPLGTFFSKDSTEGNIETPLLGTNVPLSFTIRNNHASNVATIWGAAKVAAIIG